ncbi:hypothetical protein ABT126_26080 [Streptomyces sp. NPDC002012]|uniref:hypothetical protein n=1 Tax=Streptomyces sp. NPDC002012 TaxID=3154532 RepID=UPI00332E305C
MGVSLRAAAADCTYGDQDAVRGELAAVGLPFVTALEPRRGAWAYDNEAYEPADASRDPAWGGPDAPGDWNMVTRTFREGHTATWRAVDTQLGWWGLTAPRGWWRPPPTPPSGQRHA